MAQSKSDSEVSTPACIWRSIAQLWQRTCDVTPLFGFQRYAASRRRAQVSGDECVYRVTTLRTIAVSADNERCTKLIIANL